MSDDFISAGYFVTREIEIPTYNRWLRDVVGATEDLVPEKIISVGFGNTAPLFKWIGDFGEDCELLFGVAAERITEIDAWATARFDKEIGHPNVFFKLATAREYLDRFTNKLPNVHIVGLGLHKDFLPRVEEAERLQPRRTSDNGVTTMGGLADTGFGMALSFAQPCEPGEVLGFDVICWFSNISESWHSNGLAVDGLNKFGFRPNKYGLIDDKGNADKLARYADEIQPEPGVWLPVLVTRYSITP